MFNWFKVLRKVLYWLIFAHTIVLHLLIYCSLIKLSIIAYLMRVSWYHRNVRELNMTRSMRCATLETPDFELITKEKDIMYWMEEVPTILTPEEVDKYYLHIKCMSAEGRELKKRRLLNKINGHMFLRYTIFHNLFEIGVSIF